VDLAYSMAFLRDNAASIDTSFCFFSIDPKTMGAMEKFVLCPNCRRKNRVKRQDVGGVYRCGICHGEIKNPFSLQQSLWWRALKRVLSDALWLVMVFLLIFAFLFIGVFWIEPSWKTIACALGLVTGASLLALLQPGSNLGNGFGTALIGNDSGAGGTITTKWVAMWGLPLLPLRSYVIVGQEPTKTTHWGFGGGSEETRISYKPFHKWIHWPQVWPELRRLLWIFFGLVLLRGIYQLIKWHIL
jgi:hypothetical protein